MDNRVCARPECGMPVGMIPFKIYGRPEVYCGRTCVDAVLERKKRKEPPVKVTADDFGDSGVVRHHCDNPKCRKPLGVKSDGSVALAWKGRDGEYCSNRCLMKIEKGENVENTAETNPIVQGAPAAAAAKTKKAPTKKAAAQKAPAAAAKKAAAKKAPAADEVFRAGSTKAGLFAILKDGKLHPRKKLHDFIEKAGKSRQLIHWVLEALPKKGWKVLQNDENGFQIAKK